MSIKLVNNNNNNRSKVTPELLRCGVRANYCFPEISAKLLRNNEE